jgi:hypothetical protein
MQFIATSPLNISNAYHPPLSLVTKASFFFNLKMDSASKGGGMCAMIKHTPPHVKDDAFLQRPLIDDKRDNLRSRPRRGPSQAISPDTGRRVQGMKE